MKKILTLLILTISQSLLSQDDHKIVAMLKGTWVKTMNPKDTIQFGFNRELDHTFRLTIGNNTKYGPAGLYQFTILGTTILLQWLPSSNSGANAFPFYLSGDRRTLKIGNFYNAKGEQTLLEFQKVK